MTKLNKRKRLIKCLECNEIKPIECKNMCRNCYFRLRHRNLPKNNLCKCGCGQYCLKDFIHGHHQKLENNVNWQGGITFSANGYLMIKVVNHPFATKQGYILLHRYVYEQYYNCILLPYVILHHIDGNKLNNLIENLMPMYRDQHLILHNPLQKRWG